MAEEISFYHLTTTDLGHALPRLLEKVLEAGLRAVVRCGSEERVEALVRQLWSYKKDSFLPHGSSADGYPERQPIYLTAEAEAPNGAQVLLVVDGAAAFDLARFSRVIEMFDGGDPEALHQARERWKRYSQDGYRLVYFQQTSKGAWQKAKEVAAKE